MPESLKHKTLRGTIWSGIERFSLQGISFLVMVVMARLLTPHDYGLIGMLMVFIAVSQSLVDSGFSQALIRKLDRSETDNSTVFYFNLVVGAGLYLLLYFCAPLIADFYGQPILTPITRLLSLNIVVNSLVVVQRAILTINIDFKTQAKASLIAAVISGAVGISMAYAGFGVWSIVWYQLTSLSINAALLWLFSKWRPKATYSWESFRELFGFGSKLAFSGIIDTVYNNIYLIVIGKIFNSSDLGYYTRAQQFAEFPSSNVSGIIQRVTYPVLCTIQNDDERLRDVYRRFLRVSAFVVFPLMIGLAAVAHPLINVILTKEWSFTAVLLQIICLSMMWYPVHAINLNLLQVKGRSDLFLRLEIIKKIVGVCILCVTIPMGLVAMCWGSVVSSLIALVINTHYTGILIHVGFLRQMRDLIPTMLYSLSMGLIVYLTVTLLPNDILRLTCGTVIGIAYYLLVTKLTHSSDLKELLSLIKAR
ncbi:MAG: lipopolysaccharide biosynthesis protein [Muribaculaceae bacterium]|nr:lipopolysaccharide biosynthesis protein [Muribaculaceae bacterium]